MDHRASDRKSDLELYNIHAHGEISRSVGLRAYQLRLVHCVICCSSHVPRSELCSCSGICQQLGKRRRNHRYRGSSQPFVKPPLHRRYCIICRNSQPRRDRNDYRMCSIQHSSDISERRSCSLLVSGKSSFKIFFNCITLLLRHCIGI